MSEAVYIARCPEHGLHGDRRKCFVCRGAVDRVAMVEVATERCYICGGIGRRSSFVLAVGQYVEGECPDCEGTGRLPVVPTPTGDIREALDAIDAYAAKDLDHELHSIVEHYRKALGVGTSESPSSGRPS